MDKPGFDIRYDRVCRQMHEIDGKVDWSEPARNFEEALEYAHHRAQLIGVRQIMRRQRRSSGMLGRWISQSVR